MIQTKLKGMGVALITPFKEDESVDYDALMRMVDYLLQNNADFLCVLGTTAETPTLTEEEKKTIKKMVIDRVNGRIPILLGVGGNNTRAIVETLKNDDFTGVDAILSVVPYYNKPSQEGIYQHYKAIAEATELPIVLYNVPGRTGVNMTAETTLRIARDFKNVVAIKEASGNITQMDDIIKNKPENFNVISGDDGITFPLITLGAVGVISVIGNAFPREFSSPESGTRCDAVLLQISPGKPCRRRMTKVIRSWRLCRPLPLHLHDESAAYPFRHGYRPSRRC